MSPSVSGFGFLAGYVIMVGVASFLEKFSMKQLNPYQVNFLMAIGMAVTAVPALWIKQGSLTVPTKALPLGANRIVDGSWFYLFCAFTGKAAGGHGYRHFYELCPARFISLMDLLKRKHELGENCGHVINHSWAGSDFVEAKIKTNQRRKPG